MSTCLKSVKHVLLSSSQTASREWRAEFLGKTVEYERWGSYKNIKLCSWSFGYRM